jgi:hypothetical protein
VGYPPGPYGPPPSPGGQGGGQEQYPSQYSPPGQQPSQYSPPEQYPSQYSPPGQQPSQYSPPEQYASPYSPPEQYSTAYTPPPGSVPGFQPDTSGRRSARRRKVGGVGVLGGIVLAFKGFRALYSIVGSLVVLGALGYGGYLAYVEYTGTKPGGTYTDKGTLVGADATKGKVGDCAKDANDPSETDKTVITKCTDPTAGFRIVGITSASKLRAQRDDVCRRFPKSDTVYAQVPEGATSSVTSVTVICLDEIKKKRK